MRILHLIDPAGPGGTPCTLKLLADTLAQVGGRHDVLVAGTTAHVDMARRCGLRPLGRIRAPLNRLSLARSALRGVIRQRERTGGRYDLLHGWTVRAAASAVLGTRRRPVLATAAAGAPTAGGELHLIARRRVPVLAATPAAVAGLLAGGYPSDLVTELPPAVDPAAIAMEQRRLLRESWDADETTFVVAHLGHPAPDLDGVHALHAAGRAALTGRDVRIIAHPRSAPASERLMLMRAGLSKLIVLDERVSEPWRVVAGLDAAFTLHRPRRVERHAPLVPGPLLWAMAAGVPVIAETRYAGDWLVDDSTGIVTVQGDSNRSAARILDLFDDTGRARRIGAAGRVMVTQRFSLDAFIRRIDAAWEAVTGKRVGRRRRRPAVPDVVTVGSSIQVR